MCPLVVDSSMLLATTHIGQPFLRCNFRFEIVYEELMAAVGFSLLLFNALRSNQIEELVALQVATKIVKLGLSLPLYYCCGLEIYYKRTAGHYDSFHSTNKKCMRFKHHSSIFMCLDEIELRAWTSNADFSQGKNKKQKSLLPGLFLSLATSSSTTTIYYFP